ncbi:hypothetical protein PVAP13_7KG421601 [Panicum virgatum]|uniref:Uncharacterized protein n=1 Tax=Panicum virgatum TaxID=38727 RepID=A0A8T0QQ61_PANVG|nr:hypothetical protein PVAP13_7KG421601 [Panicum virgatum]
MGQRHAPRHLGIDRIMMTIQALAKILHSAGPFFACLIACDPSRCYSLCSKIVCMLED